MYIPYKEWFEELYDDDEAQGDEDEPEVEQQHETAHTPDVWAEGVRGCHGLNLQTRLERLVKF